MYFRFFTLVSLFCSVLSAAAQNATLSKKEIKWTGFETWSTPHTSKKVISFDDAQYPSDNELPYFIEKISKENGQEIKFNVVNPVFQPVTSEELSHLKDKNIPSEISVTSYSATDRGTEIQIFQLLPFVKKGEQTLKLTNFDIQVEKIAGAQKAPTSIHTYAENSVLKSGKFVKVKVRESGIYKLTYEALNSMGVKPENVRVFGYGGALQEQSFLLPKPDDLPEVAVWMEKGADGVFNAGDYILFYGQGLTKWNYDSSRKLFIHTLNHYANEGYYFITSDVGEGRKIADKTISVPAEANIVSVKEFVDYQVHEVEKFNLGKTGKVFYGEEFSSTLSYNFPFNFPNLANANVIARVDVAAVSSVNSTFDLKLNDFTSRQISVSMMGADNYQVGRGSNVVLSYPPQPGPGVNFNLTYNKNSTSARGYLNYLEVNVRRNLKMTGSVMFFRNADYLKTGYYSKYTLTDANQNVQIWDITDQSNIRKIAASRNGDALEFTDTNDEVKQYVAIDPTAKSAITLEPTIIGTIPNQDLHALTAADMIIITHPDFVSQSKRLANAHLEKDNLKVHVVTTEQVYNEFSSGTPDATAYRWVMKMFYDRAIAAGNPDLMPKYLLLFGRGTFDNRGIINNSGDNLVLTYQADESLHKVYSYVTDDYFGFLDNNEGLEITSHKVDVGIGRFPVVTVKHAEDVVNKSIEYMNNKTKGNWKNQLTFVADDGDNSMHIGQADSIAQTIFKSNPEFQLQKIYLDSYLQETSASGDSYPLAKKRLQGLISSGSFMLNFTGHASAAGWTDEKILLTNDVNELFNKKLPIWIGATCDFVLFDSKDISAGENVVLNPVGGGIGNFSAARVVYAAQNERINRYFSTDLFTRRDGKYPRLGDAVRRAKNTISTENNKMSYVLLGDPALRLNYPETYKVVTESINGITTQSADTLKALSVNKVKGFVANQNGSKATDFNGTIEITILDKIQRITTLNNHNEKNGVFTFSDRPNILYSGKAKAENGEFEFTFMMPRDIRYNYGSGRINYYANDTITGLEGQGFFENFIVGGSKSGVEYETEGPVIQMYLNTPDFTSGGKVNETPMFVAKISDINGINTVGSGIGHDLRLVIDDDPYTSYTLNENFEAETNSYQAGRVQFKLPKMAPGKHTLTFHAWDLLNNSSQATLEFEVVEGLKPVIYKVMNFPNPVKTETTFVIEHDRPEVILETHVDIYDLAGRRLYTKQQSSADNLKWDVTDDAGNRVKPGMYLYNISVKTTNSVFTSKANKIIVLGQ